jgi:hypothetical protein
MHYKMEAKERIKAWNPIEKGIVSKWKIKKI